MYSGMKLGECWEINSSVPSLCCLPADHHGTTGQMHSGVSDQISILMLKYGSVVGLQLSLQWLILVCTLLMQQRLQVSQCRICRNHNKCQVWTCHSCICPALCLPRPLGRCKGWPWFFPPPQLLPRQALAWQREAQTFCSETDSEIRTCRKLGMCKYPWIQIPRV